MFFRFVSLVSLLLPTANLLSQSLPLPAEKSAATAQHFVCNTGYTSEQCHLQMAKLKQVLDKYPADRLGEWTWVLIRSQDWKKIKRLTGLDPDSPAFTLLSRRETFFEEALVAPVPERSAQLIQQWSSSIDDLLTLAVTHELGHALCTEKDEHRADASGRLLRAGKEVSCR